MNEQEMRKRKLYNIVLSIFRLVMVVFFAYQTFGDSLKGTINTIILIKLIVLALYVLGMGLLPLSRLGLYIESFAVAGIMIFVSVPSMISLFVFPIATTIVTRLSIIDMVIVPFILFGMIFYGFGWSPITIGFSVGLFRFFFIKEMEYVERTKDVKRLFINISKKEDEIRELQGELVSREKENESLMEVFIRTKSLNERIDIEELIQELIEAPKSFFNAEYVSIYVLDGDRYRLLKENGDGHRYDIDKTIAISVGETPIISPKQLRVPVKLDKKSWGVLDIYGKKDEVMNGQKISSNFNEDDYAFIATYTGQVMFSIKHAKLLLKMEEMATTDPLTKLANRRHFEQQFDYLLKQAKRGYELALIALDIDFFKKFNDEYGHKKGDEALIIVSEVLQAYVREMDFVGRTGGEEFCILVPNGNEKVVEIAERLRKKVSIVPFVRTITISIGISYYGVDGTTIDELMKKADEALYMAKENGRNQVVEYHKGINRS